MEAVKSILRSSEIFSGLSESHLDLVASAIKIRKFAAGDYLFQQGDDRKACFVIAEGQVEVTRDNGDGPEPLILLGPGDTAGEQAFLTSVAHTASARVHSDSVLLELDRQLVLERLGQDGGAAIAILSKVSNVLHRRLVYTGSSRMGREQD